MKGVVIPVVAYSNQPEVELFLNGKSLGREAPGPLGDFLWKVPFNAGTLKAVAYSQNRNATASETLETAGEPVNLALETDNPSLLPNRTDTAVVTVTAVDQKNNLVPWDANRIDFKVTGPVHLLGYENGDPTDVTSNQAPWRRMFYGMERGFFESTAQPGVVDVTAAAILGDESLGFEGSSRRMIAIAVQRVALRGELIPASFDIRYTTDGTEPKESSKIYAGPFPVEQDTVVRALILRNQKPFMTTRAHFWKVDPTLISDPRWATDSQVDPVNRNK
jgi:beta-galactosidase